MKRKDFVKSKVFNMVELLDYQPNSVQSKLIIDKPTGSACLFSFDDGEVFSGKILPFDNLIQVMEGKAEIIINDISNLLQTGESIFVPAHCRSLIKAVTKLKILSTIIKSGYEEITF